MKFWSQPRFLIFGLLLSATSLSAAEGPLRSTLERSNVADLVGGEARLSFTLHNDGTEPLYVLARQTPLRGLRADLFDVRREGERVPYVGPLHRFAPPRPVDYVRLEPGESLTVPVDLEGSYDIAKSGRYSVRFRPGLEGFRRNGEAAFVAITSTPASTPLRFVLEREETAAPEAHTAPTLENANPASLVPTTFLCSTSRINQIQQALPVADTMATKALTTLNNGITGPVPPTYTTWFGAFSPTLYMGVLLDFANIQKTLDSRQLSFYCDCFEADTYAYTSKAQQGHIHLCPLFWSAPLSGLNSKADTLVHESSHWPSWGADSDDYVYGITNSKNLALFAPGFAVDNADNFAYFASSQP
ncbi:MAG: M35 family metallo-endopeptidase [Thermoanaerobaculia bacterium]|nr:M35 family metallo-endopeptidase [Thermoanaerobaculia bacterium]